MSKLLDREDIFAIFTRHHGAATKLAGELEVTRSTLSGVLRGRNSSQRILEAARARAMELLAGERQRAKELLAAESGPAQIA